jgi:tRNA pseudouridine55 synthase
MSTVQADLNIFEQGQVLLIDKPLGWTSFDVVRKVRNQIKIKKVGHAGTLDPLATGLLILCTGKFTRQINTYMAQEKEYTGTITLGAVTPTYDLESEPQQFLPWEHISEALILEAFTFFTGALDQKPPMHSAVKKDGKRLYELARKGKEVEVEPRKITISAFELVKADGAQLHFRVACSTGTYIRSLAHDLGQHLGCGAYLSSLCRTRIGAFTLQEALTMEQVAAFIQEKKVRTDS